MKRARTGAIFLAAAALGLACLRERGGPGGAVWTDPGAPASLAAGLALLAFWAAAALRAGRAAALTIDPRGRGAAAALWTIFHAYVLVLLMVLCAAAAGQINAIFLTILAAVVYIAIGKRYGRDGAEREAVHETAARAAAHGTGLAALFRNHPLASLIVAVVAALTMVNAVWAFILPPFAHDDFTYHLVFPVEWAQSGTLSMKAVPFGNHSPPYYPMNTEMFYLWLFLPFREAFHINASQVLFLGLSVLALLDIFRRCGASVRASLVAAALFCLSPVAVAEAGKAYVDVAFAAFFLVSLNAVLAYGSRPTRLKALQLAAAIGVFAGTKIPGVVFSAVILIPLLAVVLFLAARKASRQADGRNGQAARIRSGAAAAVLAAAVAIFFAAGGWWYVRNLIVTGNPVFPLDVELFGATLFQGAYGREALPFSNIATLLELHTPPLLALLAAGAIVTAAGVVGSRRGGRPAPGAALLAGLLLPALLAALFHFFLPFDYARFVLALCGLAGALLLVPLDAGRSIRLAAEVAILAVLAASFLVPPWREKLLLPLLEGARLENSVLVWGAFALGLLTAGAFVLSQAAGARPLMKTGSAACSAALLFFFFWAGSLTADPDGAHFSADFRKSREPYIHLHRNYRGLTVAAAGTNRSFLLYGRDFSSRVRYVNVNRSRGWMLHDFVHASRNDRAAPGSDRNAVRLYRRDARYPAWAANLDAAGADILFVERLTGFNLQKEYARDAQGFPLESIWAERHPEKFRKVYDSPVARIYEVLR